MPRKGKVEPDRLIQVWILPALFGLAAAAALGLPFGRLWQMAGTNEDILNALGRADANALEQLTSSFSALAAVVTIVAWASAVGWFARCWRTRVAQVGTVQRGRTAWLCIGVGGLLASYLAAAYIVWAAPFWSLYPRPLSSLITENAEITTLLFVGPFYSLTYWVISVLCTHAVYVPAIPWSTWRT